MICVLNILYEPMCVPHKLVDPTHIRQAENTWSEPKLMTQARMTPADGVIEFSDKPAHMHINKTNEQMNECLFYLWLH